MKAGTSKLPHLYSALVELLQPAKVTINGVRLRLKRLLKKTPDLFKDSDVSGTTLSLSHYLLNTDGPHFLTLLSLLPPSCLPSFPCFLHLFLVLLVDPQNVVILPVSSHFNRLCLIFE